MVQERGRKAPGTTLGVLVGSLCLALVAACAGPNHAKPVTGKPPSPVGRGSGSCGLAQVSGCGGLDRPIEASAVSSPASSVAPDPGSAIDVGVGANGSVWVVGTNPVAGGFGLWHWTGTAWAASPGGALRIAVDPGGNPWVVNSLHSIYRWSGAGWIRLPGSATDVGVGANGSVWVVGTNPLGGGFGLWHWTGTAWAASPGGAVRIAVDPGGNPWVVNSLHSIYRWSGVGWIRVPGSATGVGVGANGSAWLLGTNPAAGGFGLWQWTGTAWAASPGGAVAIAVDPAGNPWLVNSSHQILSVPSITPGGCGLAAPAFCDNFTNEQPPSVTRSGPLSAVWGVSRVSNYQNPSQGNVDTWDGSTMGAEDDTATGYCGNQQVINNDVQICPGVPGIVDTTNDGSGNGSTGGTLSILAMYPRQPFDIAGRTGTVKFDATDNTEGGHGAWPTFVYTDQPVPAPYGVLPPQACSPPSATCDTAADNARNSVGVNFDGGGAAGGSPNCVGVGDMWVTVNYVEQELNLDNDGGCVALSTIETGMDHFEVQISAAAVTVYGESYNGSSFVLLASAAFKANGNPALPLTRGLTWMEDVHYNADKFSNFPKGDGGPFNQALNSFEWDNFGFDGPVLPRDEAIDVPDNTTPGPTQTSAYGSTDTGYPSTNIGYLIHRTGPLTFTLNSVTTAGATGALVVFTGSPWAGGGQIKASLNGNTPVEIPNSADIGSGMATFAIPFPASEVVNGTNTLKFTDPGLTTNGYGETLANIDLIVQGAGGTVQPGS